MAARRDARYLRGLLGELRSSREAEWVEFKVDNEKPALIGEYISALANAAALAGKPHGYVVWGVEDKTRALNARGERARISASRAGISAGSHQSWRAADGMG